MDTVTHQALSDTTLTMIVRDELMNPAGGLLPMLEYHLPYFPEAVVVDTGSVDGTRQLLEHLQQEYPHLRVEDHQFVGFGRARTYANSKVRTRYSMILDADEMISSMDSLAHDINTVAAEAEQKSVRYSLHFDFLWIPTQGAPSLRNENVLRLRLFPQSQVRFFYGEVYEYPNTLSPFTITSTAKTVLRHFVPERDLKKRLQFYRPLMDIGINTSYEKRFHQIRKLGPPSSKEGFASWKTPNPAVLRTYGINLDEILGKIHQLGLHVDPRIRERLENTKTSP
ncbi:glycosyltransferase [Candidatus Woesearchaeota archaeon]|nr:glycosyltransferase [Candidatus Woesearchaeota archaeon]